MEPGIPQPRPHCKGKVIPPDNPQAFSLPECGVNTATTLEPHSPGSSRSGTLQAERSAPCPVSGWVSAGSSQFPGERTLQSDPRSANYHLWENMGRSEAIPVGPLHLRLHASVAPEASRTRFHLARSARPLFPVPTEPAVRSQSLKGWSRVSQNFWDPLMCALTNPQGPRLCAGHRFSVPVSKPGRRLALAPRTRGNWLCAVRSGALHSAFTLRVRGTVRAPRLPLARDTRVSRGAPPALQPRP